MNNCSRGYGFLASSRPVAAGEVASGPTGRKFTSGLWPTCRLLGTESGWDYWQVFASALRQWYELLGGGTWPP